MNWTELLKSEAEATYAASFGLIDMLEDGDLPWKPETGDNWMTLAQLLMHMTTACGWCCRAFVTGDWGMPEGEMDGEKQAEMSDEATLPLAETMPVARTVAQVRVLLEKDREVALAMIEQAGEETLTTKLTAAPWEPSSEVLLGKRLLGMVAHLAQHKGQLFYYLKLMGRDVNTINLWG